MGIIVDSCKDMINQDDKYLEFWSIKLRLESHANLLDFFKNYINNSQDISLIETQLLKLYLTNQNKFLDETLYLEFWRSLIKEIDEKSMKFEFIASLLLLCRTDKSEFIKSIEYLQTVVEQRIFEEVKVEVKVEENNEKTINNNEEKNDENTKLVEEREEIIKREKEKCTNKEKLFQLVKYYTELVYSKTTSVLYRGGEISCINSKINNEKFEDNVCIKFTESLLIAEKENLSFKDFFYYNYDQLNNLTLLKESLIKASIKLEEKDLAFNLTHL